MKKIAIRKISYNAFVDWYLKKTTFGCFLVIGNILMLSLGFFVVHQYGGNLASCLMGGLVFGMFYTVLLIIFNVMG
jgi:lipopolysaccharide export LptBFGC system permease protein LptF